MREAKRALLSISEDSYDVLASIPSWDPMKIILWLPLTNPFRKRQPVYVQHNIEARSCNHRFSGKSISITYSECVSVALFNQHANRMRHVVIDGLPGSVIQGC
jgi:hypothetical protein